MAGLGGCLVTKAWKVEWNLLASYHLSSVLGWLFTLNMILWIQLSRSVIEITYDGQDQIDNGPVLMAFEPAFKSNLGKQCREHLLMLKTSSNGKLILKAIRDGKFIARDEIKSFSFVNETFMAIGSRSVCLIINQLLLKSSLPHRFCTHLTSLHDCFVGWIKMMRWPDVNKSPGLSYL